MIARIDLTTSRLLNALLDHRVEQITKYVGKGSLLRLLKRNIPNLLATLVDIVRGLLAISVESDMERKEDRPEPNPWTSASVKLPETSSSVLRFGTEMSIWMGVLFEQKMEPL